MNASATRYKNNKLSNIAAVLMGFFLQLGLQGCGSSNSGPDNRPTLSINAPTVVEGQAGDANELIFTVTLSENAATTLTLSYTTADDVATIADNDYTAANGSVTIQAGTSTANISVFTQGDVIFEVPETFNLVVDNPQGLSIKTTSITGQGTITNDDNANPKGYFSGNARLNAIDLTDITGMMYNGRLMLFSPSQNVLFDITAFNSTVNDYTANADVYEAGFKTETITLAGTTDEMSITGTFDGGSGLATGSFSIVFDVNNNVAATSERILHPGAGNWAGTIYGVEIDPRAALRTDPDLITSGDYTMFDYDSPSCTTYEEVMTIPDEQINIYQLSHNVSNRDLGDNVRCLYISTGHTGFTSVLSIDSVNTLVFAYANGAISLFGIMTY